MTTLRTDIIDMIFPADARQIDVDANARELDNIELSDYSTVNIVSESIINGQLKQAKQQAKEYDLDYQEIYEEVKGCDPID